jgi:hypothetical protein
MVRGDVRDSDGDTITGGFGDITLEAMSLRARSGPGAGARLGLHRSTMMRG